MDGEHVSGHVLSLQRSWIWFSAPVLGSLISRESETVFLDSVVTFTHVRMSSLPTPTHIHMIKNKSENLNK